MDTCKINVSFSKKGILRYISHLDFMRLIYRALRRAELPFMLSEGFNPRPKIKFGQALKLGVPGIMEVVFSLKTPISLDEFKTKMHHQLTEDIRILEISYGK
ncbi:MAG: TIGR03936 family radical SAM-associated protein [Candidatus Omnitrophica bacterium]|nr:TIGR03936 family radical SAM-associated protein [Candidatus Omnitrophota bacterium]